MLSRMSSNNFRISFLIFLFFVLAATIVGRLFYIQIIKHDEYKKLADSQHIRKSKLLAKRGTISFSDGQIPLAENKGTRKVYIATREIEDPESTSKILANLLEMDEKEVFEKVSNKEDPWVFLKEIPATEGEKIKNIKGVHFEMNFEREYPQREMASHVVGFCNKENKGQYGLEEYYQNNLRGKDGFREGVVDAKGREIFSSFNKIQDPIDGDNLVLTLDYNIQFFIEGKLEESVKKYGADGGTIIVSDPKTGEILAMASRGPSNKPKFDPNEFPKFEMEDYKNPAISIPFEPGSIFKPITMAGALEEGVVAPDTTYIDKGEVRIGSHIIRNADLKSHGEKTMTEVLELSLNTGAVFVEEKLGREKFIEYVKKFGFGKKTGIDLAGEVPGSISNILYPKSKEKKIEYANASFGQGIAVTPIQIVAAFSAIANQGKMVRPHVVKKIIHPDKTEEEIQPETLCQVISPQTASWLTAMMVSVVKRGYGKKAGVDGYLIAGKTGTAQVPDIKRGGYFPDRTIHSFVGFAPAFDPEFLIFLKLDNPHGVRFSSDSLAPVFHDIAQYLFSYLGIPPNK